MLKVDMRNAFNLVSRQAILDECASLFSELLPTLGIMVLWYTFSTMASDGPRVFRIRGSAGGPSRPFNFCSRAPKNHLRSQYGCRMHSDAFQCMVPG